MTICKKCGEDCGNGHFMCDLEDGEWCGECFGTTSCGKGEHGEGCPTLVTEDDDAQAS
jgi:hypothetical protein